MMVLFWLSLGLILYCYFGYPLFLALLSKVLYKPVIKGPLLPKVSVIISVWNEEDVIGPKLKNLLSLDYPSDRMEILIGSDGSDDKTSEIVSSFDDPRIKFYDFKQRRGKMAVLNELVALSKNEIIVFNDARQEISTNAIRQLISNFADSSVGCVSGELIFRPNQGSTGRGINLYWEYEKFMRDHEARVHSMLGATGAIYAIRRDLYKAVPDDVVLDDMYIPFRIIERGYRAVFEPEAKAFDDVAENPKEEYRRKTRTLYGNFQIFGIFCHMFNPFKSPIAVQFFSHKFLRVVAPFFMIALFVANFFLIERSFYRSIMFAQFVFYLLAFLGIWTKELKNYGFGFLAKICYIPYVFCLLNFSVFIGFWRFISSKQEIAWEKARD